MFARLRGNLKWLGSAFFRGDLIPRSEEFDYLKTLGVAASLAKQNNDGWLLHLHHPEWGDADLFSGPTPGPPPRELIDLDPRLAEDEKQELASAGRSLVTIRMTISRSGCLRERKHALRYLRAVMGHDGVGTVDHMGERFWSRIALDEELAHDADLDVESLFSMHCVSDDDRASNAVAWLHTHGLAAMGFYDFDILRPHEDAYSARTGITRAIAFTVIEGRLKPNGASVGVVAPGGKIRMVDAATFMRSAAEPDRQLRDAEDHDENRCVVCEPVGNGWLGRLFRRDDRPRPSRWVQREMDDRSVVQYSTEATELMATRARQTYSLFRQVTAEMAEFEFPALVKIGYAVDGGGPDEREHLWFQVHVTAEDTVDATLVNQPLNIAALNEGDRSRHPVEQMTDWTIITPVGQITPSNLLPRRIIHQLTDELRQAMRAQQGR